MLGVNTYIICISAHYRCSKYLHYMYICTLQVYIRKSPICGYGHRLVGQILKLSQTPLSKRKYIVNLWPSTKKTQTFAGSGESP